MKQLSYKVKYQVNNVIADFGNKLWSYLLFLIAGTTP